MSYKEKPQIKLYKYENNAFSLVAIIDDYSECSWENNRFQAGVFSISINYNIPNALLFAEKLWVQFGNNPYSFGEINKITDRIGADGKGSQIRTITGYDARYIFKRRIIKSLNNENTWSMTAKGEICMRSLIADQCGASAEAKRRLPVVNTIPAVNDAIGSVYSVSESFTNLYEVLRTIATQTEIGWRIRFDGELTLEFYEGEDRRETVRFDTNYDSLQDGEFTDSLESYANSILISGKGTGADRDIYEGETGTPQGLDRFEAYSNQSEMTTEEEYEAQAQSMLSQYGQTLTVSGNGLAKCPYIYGEQYDVGDIITVSFSGKSAVVQILSVTEHWRHGAYDITFSFGKPQNTLSEQLQIMLRKIQQASDKTTATSSVKWYTIPTDTAMSASDVTYDTIGFTGDCGSGATFTLYLDDESTGAKEYNVYFKNLSGGKITLTTGKAGAENAVMNSGTYVARVYVDPQGNITVQSATATSVIASGNNQPATSNGVAGAISAEEYARNMAIANAINALDVAQTGGDGKYIESISETDGKISATAKSLGNMVPVDEVTDGNMHSVTSNAVANYTPFHSYGVVATPSATGSIIGTGNFSDMRYIRVASGGWDTCCKIFIQFEGGNMADRIEITVSTGNTDYIQCYGLFATNSGCVKAIFLCNKNQRWDSDWDLYVGLVVPYYTTIYVKDIVKYVGSYILIVDGERTTEPPNIAKRIDLTNSFGFFYSS